MKKLTPVLLVDLLDDALEFWCGCLGFKKTLEVPADPDAAPGLGNPPGFVILQRGGVELMLQSRASVRRDVPALAAGAFSCTGLVLFIEVSDFDAVREAVRGCEIAIEERVTFYGMREIGVRAPDGPVVILACREE